MFGHHYRDWRGNRGRAGNFGWDEFAPWLREIGTSRTGRRRRGGGRMLKHGELRLLLLALVEHEPMHGYAMIEAVETRTGGRYAPSPGIVYPSLTFLADMELVEEQAEGSRKSYAITEQGRLYLEKHRHAADAILARLDAAGDAGMGRNAAPVGRAMLNLGTALKAAVWQSGPDRNTALAIAEILDDAARKIEALD